MVDAPVLRRAERIVHLAGDAGSLAGPFYELLPFRRGQSRRELR